MIPLGKIRVDPFVWARATKSEETVAGYAEDLANGATFPPVVCFADGSGVFWLSDGYYRVWANERAGRKSVAAEVRPGGRAAAKLHAAGSNISHGLRRTAADKRLSVLAVLGDETAKDWPRPKIAAYCGVSTALVDALRARMKINPGKSPAELAATGALPDSKSGPPSPVTVFRPPPKPSTSPGSTPYAAILDPDDVDDKDEPEAPAPAPQPRPRPSGSLGDAAAADDDDELDAEIALDEAADRERVKVQLARALRKADRFAVALGMTLAEAVRQFDIERAAARAASPDMTPTHPGS